MGPERQVLNGQGLSYQPAGDQNSSTTGLLEQSEKDDTAPGASCLRPPTAKKQLFHTAPKESANNKHCKAGTTNHTLSASLSRGLPGFHTHRIAEEVLQGAPLNVLSEEIQLLVLVQYTDELQHIGVIQAAHHFHLGSRDTHTPPQKKRMEQVLTDPLCGDKHSNAGGPLQHSNPNLKAVN